VALLAERRPSLHLAVAGRGGLEHELVALSRKLGVAGRVHWLGLRSDIANLLAAADIFALSSLSEGHSLSLLEAMTAARPIVATDVGAARETLEDGHCGLLVPPSNPLRLAEAIDRLLSKPAEAARLAERAAQRAASMYSTEIMVERYAELYARVLGPAPAASPSG
jgi:glycosyltransferase involved in cell wall biosynthesis